MMMKMNLTKIGMALIINTISMKIRARVSNLKLMRIDWLKRILVAQI